MKKKYLCFFLILFSLSFVFADSQPEDDQIIENQPIIEDQSSNNPITDDQDSINQAVSTQDENNQTSEAQTENEQTTENQNISENNQDTDVQDTPDLTENTQNADGPVNEDLADNPFSLKLAVDSGLGFFSPYAGLSLSFFYDLDNFNIGLEQRFLYGFSFKEISASSCLVLPITSYLYYKLGVSYLVYDDVESEPSFKNNLLPCTGIGFELKLTDNLLLNLELEYLQSFFLSEDYTSTYYTDDFYIGCVVLCNLQWIAF